MWTYKKRTNRTKRTTHNAQHHNTTKTPQHHNTKTRQSRKTETSRPGENNGKTTMDSRCGMVCSTGRSIVDTNGGTVLSHACDGGACLTGTAEQSPTSFVARFGLHAGKSIAPFECSLMHSFALFTIHFALTCVARPCDFEDRVFTVRTGKRINVGWTFRTAPTAIFRNVTRVVDFGSTYFFQGFGYKLTILTTFTPVRIGTDGTRDKFTSGRITTIVGTNGITIFSGFHKTIATNGVTPLRGWFVV